MSNKKKFNQVILLHPNTYYLLLDNQLSSDFITRKLFPYLNDKSITDFNKWMMIKQELNMFMRRKTKSFKPALENSKANSEEKINNDGLELDSMAYKTPNNTLELNHMDSNLINKFDSNEHLSTSTPKFHIKKKYKQFYDHAKENETINDFKKLPAKEDNGKFNDSNQKRQRHQESPIVEVNEEYSGSDTPKKTKSNKKAKPKNTTKPSTTNPYVTRSMQKGESWIKWISLK